MKSVESLLADKQAIAAREKKLIDDLNAALGKMGYKVVPTARKTRQASGFRKKPDTKYVDVPDRRSPFGSRGLARPMAAQR